MKDALLWCWRLIARNFLWKLLALAIAVGIWAFVVVEPELATSVTVLMEYDGLPDGLEISSLEPANNSVTLEIRGPSAALRGLGEKDGPRVAVVLDMTGVRAGVSTFMIGEGNVRLARGLRVVRAIPSEARFQFEPTVTRSAPVNVQFKDESGDGSRVAHYTVTPSKVEITGPASHVNRVPGAVTDPVDVSHVEGDAEFPVNVFVNDAYVRFQSPPQVTVSVSMKKR